MGNSFGSYAEPDIQHNYRAEASPWCKMMTSARRNSDGVGATAQEVTMVICITKIVPELCVIEENKKMFA